MKLVIVKMEGKNSDEFTECDQCHGYGSSLNEKSNTCSKCNGKGIISKK